MIKNKHPIFKIGDEVEVRMMSKKWKGGFKIVQVLKAESQETGGAEWLRQFSDGWAYYVHGIAHGLCRDVIKAHGPK